MQDSMRQLLVVQRIDTAIAGAEAELARIPAERDSIAAEVAGARELVDTHRATVETAELEERHLESKMRDQEALLARLNDQCSQVSSTQAYDALQHEIEHATNAGSECETRALELMETIDDARSQLAAAEEKLESLENAAPDQLDEIATREARHESDRAAHLEERAKEITIVDATVLRRYDRIATIRRPAVTVLVTDACPECNIKLPRQVVSQVRHAEELHNCSNCQRLLVPASIVGD